MEAVRARLSALTVAEHGVDGEKIYVYGEGWDFGEVGGGQRGAQRDPVQHGRHRHRTFSDRLRDAVRGGGPFDSTESLRRNQGFINGLFYDPNELNSGSDTEKASLLHQSDLIRVGMAGNLRDFVLTSAEGHRRGRLIDQLQRLAGRLHPGPAGSHHVHLRARQPDLFDNNQYKIPTGTDMATRVRAQNVGLGIVLLGQGVPFLHAGVDMLRSKSMERDSYNSGDWYNRLDVGYHDNNWNVGLPRADNDGGNYGVIRPIIADPSISPSRADIRATVKHVREMLRIRKSSRLFRIEEGAQVATRVDFHNSGPSQIPGLIVMSVTDGVCAGDDLDPDRDGIVILVNGSDEDQTFALAGTALEGETGFTLHEVQQHSADPEICDATFDGAAFTVPARSVVVFEQAQGGEQGDGLACNTKVPEVPQPEPGEFTVPVYLRGEMNDWGTANLLERTATSPTTRRSRWRPAPISSRSPARTGAPTTSARTAPSWCRGDSLILERPGGNITLNVAADGTYLFSVSTAENILAPVLTISAAP